MYTSCGFQSNLQVQSSLVRVVTVDNEVVTNSCTLHTLNVGRKAKKPTAKRYSPKSANCHILKTLIRKMDMKKLVFLVLLFFLIISNVEGQTAIIKGNIGQNKVMKIELSVKHSNDLVLVMFPPHAIEKLSTKSSANGDFTFQINHIEQLFEINELKIGKNIIYIGIEPNDTIDITIQNNNIAFKGHGFEKEYFVQYLKTIDKKRPPVRSLLKQLYPFDTLCMQYLNNYKMDIDTLMNYQKKYHMDSTDVKIYGNFLKNTIYSSAIYSLGKDYDHMDNKYIPFLDSFQINDCSLKMNLVYHNALFRYLTYRYYKQNKTAINFDKDLGKLINFSNEVLSDSIKDYQWSFILGNWLTWKSKDKQLQGLVLDYLNNSKNTALKEMIRNKAILEKVIE